MSLSNNSQSLLDISHLCFRESPQIAIVATEWNEKIVKEQINGAKRVAAIAKATISQECYVPGSFELTFACKHLWKTHFLLPSKPDAIIAFGAVIRGGTPHFDYVCKSVVEGLTILNIKLPIPIIFGVLTLDNEAQAWERLGGAHGHKGEEAMITALKMIQFHKQTA